MEGVYEIVAVFVGMGLFMFLLLAGMGVAWGLADYLENLGGR